MKRRPIDAAKNEKEIKRDFYTPQPPPSEIMYSPDGNRGVPVIGLRAVRLPSEEGDDDES